LTQTKVNESVRYTSLLETRLYFHRSSQTIIAEMLLISQCSGTYSLLMLKEPLRQFDVNKYICYLKW